MGVLPHNPFRKQMLVMALASWGCLLLLVLFVYPTFLQDVVWKNSYLPFFILLGLALFWSIWGLSGRWKRSVAWAGAGLLLVFLRVNQLDSWINIGLLLSFCFVWEYYWHLSKQPTHLIK